MAWFGSKKSTQNTGGTTANKVELSPEKARRFFEHAGAVHESGSYEYAMSLWLNGLRFDPGNIAAVEGFFRSGDAYFAESGKKSVSKDLARSVDGSTDVDRYLRALLELSLERDAITAVRAAEQAAKLKLVEVTAWLTDRAAALVLKDKSTRKDLLLRLRDCYGAANEFEKAMDMAERAQRLDPTDGSLAAEIRDLAARSAMNKGGYAQAGEAGGFRAMIRDADQQRRLDEGERIVKSESTLDRLIADAEADYQRRPDDIPTIKVLAQRLLERGRPEDEERAWSLYMSAYERFKQFDLRRAAGDIRIRQARRRAAEARQRTQGAPPDSPQARDADEAARQLLDLEIAELGLRVEAYPTDLGLRYELGRRYFMRGEYEQAIAHFQEVQHDVKHRLSTLNMMGQAFFRMGWIDEAESTFRKALDVAGETTADMLMELRYGLMEALMARAEQTGDLSAAEEADRLASQIAIQQINFRDIRTKRDAIKKVLAGIRAAQRG